jgi:hypothetical protein
MHREEENASSFLSAETSTYRGGRKNPNGQEDDEHLRTGFIESESEVFELARELFDTHSGQGVD